MVGYIKKLLRESLINEFLTRDMVNLKTYFTMTNDEILQYLPLEYCYLFDNFIDEEDIGFYKNVGEESCEIVEYIENNDKLLYGSFAKWLFNKIHNHELPISDSEYPAWSFFGEPELIKNQWLIHFTDNPMGIKNSGFKYGVDEMDKLGLTTHLGEFHKKYGGYNFSYTLSDYIKYARNNRGFKYGSDAVIFRASGLRLWHYSDEEYQTIFYGNTAKDIIPIVEIYGDYCIYSNDGGSSRLLYKSIHFDDVVNWLIINFDQYRKKLL